MTSLVSLDECPQISVLGALEKGGSCPLLPNCSPEIGMRFVLLFEEFLHFHFFILVQRYRKLMIFPPFWAFSSFWLNFCLMPAESKPFKGYGMGPLLVLVSPCFRENVVVTCKSGSFLCSLDNLFQINVIVFFFGNQISKWRSFEKGTIFYLLFTFFSSREKLLKFLQHISHTHTHTYMYFAHPIDLFCLTNFEKYTNLSGMVSL